MKRIRYRYKSDEYGVFVISITHLFILFIWWLVVFYCVIPYLNPHGFYEKFLTVVFAFALLVWLLNFDDKTREVVVQDDL